MNYLIGTRLKQALLSFVMLMCTWCQAQILIVGDSVGAGYGVAEEHNWVSLLQEEIPRQRVINASISGDTSSGAKRRLPALLKHYQPEIVVIEIGGNDGLRGQPVSLLEQNLKTMIDLSHQAGAEVLLLGMHIPPNYGKTYTEAFHQTYHKVARAKNVRLLPFLLEGIALDSTLMQADRIHPNEQAQPKIVQNVLPLVQDMLN